MGCTYIVDEMLDRFADNPSNIKNLNEYFFKFNFKPYKCKVCSLSFSNLDNLFAHYVDGHSLSSPSVFYDDRRINDSIIFRNKKDLKKLSFLNVHTIIEKDSENKETFTEETIINFLTNYDKSKCHLKIVSKDQIIEELFINFRIINEKFLDDIDKKFISVFSVENNLSWNKINEFEESFNLNEENYYLKSLCNYLRGVLYRNNDFDKNIKSIDRNRYKEVFNRSLEELKYYDRPIAKTITNIIKLISSDFKSFHFTGVLKLDYLLSFVNQISINGEVSSNTKFFNNESNIHMQNFIPVDNSINKLLEFFDNCCDEQNFSNLQENDILKLLRNEDIFSNEKLIIKVLSLWFNSYYGNAENYKNILESLKMNVIFKKYLDTLR